MALLPQLLASKLNDPAYLPPEYREATFQAKSILDISITEKHMEGLQANYRLKQIWVRSTLFFSVLLM